MTNENRSNPPTNNTDNNSEHQIDRLFAEQRQNIVRRLLSRLGEIFSKQKI